MHEHAPTPWTGSGDERPVLAAKQSVLLVSDDLDLAGIWSYALRQKGLAVRLAVSAEEALAGCTQSPCDLVVIDVCGPDLNGIALVGQLRSEGVNPILLFTPIRDEAHLLAAYQAGVDECAVKPVSPLLFLAKVHAWLRRCWSVPAQALGELVQGPLRLNSALHEVSCGGAAPVALSNLEFRVLYLLMCHPGQLLSADHIVERVWGLSGEGDSVLLKNVVYRLRRKIEPDPNQPRYLQTAGKQGYLFSPD